MDGRPRGACGTRYTVTRLAAPPGRGFEPLTYPALAGCLAAVGRNPSLLAVGATVAGEPAALALAEIGIPDPSTASLLSIATAAPHRRQGIARRLLEELEGAARTAGCSRVRAVIPDDLPAVHLFRNSLWGPALPERLVARAWVDALASAPWTRLWYPAGYEMFPWHALAESDLRELHALEERRAFPEYLHPLRLGHDIDPEASTGLRLRGRLVGWFICHRTGSEDTRLVNSLFATLDTASHGRAAPLLGRSLRRLRGSGVRKLVWEVQAGNGPMLRFTMKRLAPWSYSVRRASAVVKNL